MAFWAAPFFGRQFSLLGDTFWAALFFFGQSFSLLGESFWAVILIFGRPVSFLGDIFWAPVFGRQVLGSSLWQVLDFWAALRATF